MAKPKLALIPAAQGTSLYSVLPSSGVGDFQFSRSGSATRINSQGLIETVGSGVSRLNYSMIDGVVKGCPHHILEPERTNYVYNSIVPTGYGNITRTLITSPTGELNGTRLTEIANFGQHYASISVSSITIGNVYTFSLFIRKGVGSDKVAIYTQNSTIDTNIVVDFSRKGLTLNGANCIVGSEKIEEYPNDWYRISWSGTPIQTSGFSMYITTLDLNQYLGDTENYIDYYGFQCENGSYVTSLINTTGTIATRSAETANGSGSAATFNSEQGVLMAEISALADDNTDRKIGIVQGSTQNQVSIGYSISTKKIRAISYDGAVKGETFTNVVDVLNSNKIAYKYKDGDNQLWVNGFLLDTSINTNILDGITLDNLGFDANASNFYGNTKQLQYFDTVLTDSELEQLTSWVSFQEMAEAQLYSVE